MESQSTEETKLKSTTTIARISRNDQDITRAIDIAHQLKVYRAIVVEAGVAPSMADQMVFRFNERILAERFTPVPPVEQIVRVLHDDE